MEHGRPGMELHAPLHAWFDSLGALASGKGGVPRRPCVVAIGKFDGIHLGHRALLREVVTDARCRGWSAGVVTFDEHPRRVLFGEPLKAVTSLSERRRLLQEAGIDFQLLLHACPGLFALEADEFARRLIDTIGCKAVVMGTDFRFGRRAAGDSGTLARLGMEVMPLDLLARLGRKVSTTRVREVLDRGDVEQAAELLARPFGVSGRWERSAAMTWSLRIDAGLLLPAPGVYIGRVQPSQDAADIPALLRVVPSTTASAVEVRPLHPVGGPDHAGATEARVLFERRVRDAITTGNPGDRSRRSLPPLIDDCL